MATDIFVRIKDESGKTLRSFETVLRPGDHELTKLVASQIMRLHAQRWAGNIIEIHGGTKVYRWRIGPMPPDHVSRPSRHGETRVVGEEFQLPKSWPKMTHIRKSNPMEMLVDASGIKTNPAPVRSRTTIIAAQDENPSRRKAFRVTGVTDVRIDTYGWSATTGETGPLEFITGTAYVRADRDGSQFIHVQSPLIPIGTLDGSSSEEDAVRKAVRKHILAQKKNNPMPKTKNATRYDGIATLQASAARLSKGEHR